MIYVHSLGRAVRYYGEQTALSISGKRLTFSELHNRVERIAAALSRRGLQPGEIVARGANVMLGYWNHPERTGRAFRNDFFWTEDIGYQDSAGDLFIVDRLTDMIITEGGKVYCGEVEAVIYEIPVVREAAVFGIPDSRRGALVAACVVLEPEVSLSEEELIH